MCTFVIRNSDDYKCKIMINRINLILRAKNITAKQFAEEIGIQPSGMSHIMSGRNNPSLDFVSKVIRRYPEIDANWLLLGKGEMYGQLGIRNEELGIKNNEELGMRNEESYSEPTLFSEPEPLPEPEKIAPLPEPEEDDIPLSQSQVADSSPTLGEQLECLDKEPAPIIADKRRLVKILFFYDDRTFEEYRPRS